MLSLQYCYCIWVMVQPCLRNHVMVSTCQPHYAKNYQLPDRNACSDLAYVRRLKVSFFRFDDEVGSFSESIHSDNKIAIASMPWRRTLRKSNDSWRRRPPAGLKSLVPTMPYLVG